MDFDEVVVPVDPVGLEVGNLASPEPEPATQQADDPRLESSRRGQLSARL